ncbi:hypothetical protein [Microbulbifer sp. M83]|uniref:hypothetical protein n=1 Tax=Microbulbifer sp. M83 TaxID=3118246 RepID=UPI002FE23AA2
MALIVGAMPGTNWKQIVPLLESLGWNWVEPLEAEEWYMRSKDSHGGADSHRYLLLHSRPEIIVANAMSLENDPIEALEQWKASANSLIAFYMNNRDRTILLEIEAILQHPERFVKSVIDYFELSPKSLDSNIFPDAFKAPPMFQLLANQFLAQADVLSGMIPEIQACTFPLTETSYVVPEVDLCSLSEEYKAKAEEEKQSRKICKELQEENALLLEQLHRMQEQLVSFYHKNEDLTGKVEKILSKNRELQAEIERAKEKVNRIRYSTSWRIMGPARVIKRSLSRKKKS